MNTDAPEKHIPFWARSWFYWAVGVVLLRAAIPTILDGYHLGDVGMMESAVVIELTWVLWGVYRVWIGHRAKIEAESFPRSENAGVREIFHAAYPTGDASRVGFDHWIKVAPDGGAFTVLMPHPPVHSTQSQSAEGGMSLTQQNYASKGGEEFCSVAYIDYPVESANRVKEADVLESMAQGIKAKCEANRLSFQYDGEWINGNHRGKYLVWLEAENRGKTTMQIYMVRNRIYMVAYTTALAMVTSGEENSNEFFESFHMKE
jgi:hypothetical protein